MSSAYNCFRFRKRSEWAIYFLVQIKSFDEVFFVKNMFAEILNSANNKIAISVCLKIDKALIASFFYECCPVNFTLTEEYSIFFCEPENNYKKNKKELVIISEPQQFDIANENDLALFFNHNTYKKDIAKRNLVVTWNHGFGYAIFKQPYKKYDGEIIGTKYKLDYDALTGTKLQMVLKKAFPVKKADLLVMVNCNINLFDFGYALKDNLKYLVAPESDIELTGYNYKEIFAAINKCPKISARKLAKFFVTSYKNKEYNHSEVLLKKAALTNKGIFCNSLVHYGRYANLLDSLALHLTTLLKTNPQTIEQIKKTRSQAQEVAGSNHSLMIDFHAFLSALKQNFPIDKKIQSIYRIHYRLLKNIVVAKYVNTETKSHSSLLNGFSICFPKDKDVFIEDSFYLDYIKQNTEYATLFSKHHIWDNFLEEYYSKL